MKVRAYRVQIDSDEDVIVICSENGGRDFVIHQMAECPNCKVKDITDILKEDSDQTEMGKICEKILEKSRNAR